MPQILDKLAALDGRYSWLRESVDKLQALAPNMNIRYDFVARTVEDATAGFNAALGVCGPLARVWLFDMQRGTSNSAFSEGSVYIDGTGAACFCNRVVDDPSCEPSAVITRMMEIAQTGRTLVAEMTVPQNASGMYLEVKDPQNIDARSRSLLNPFSCQFRLAQFFGFGSFSSRPTILPENRRGIELAAVLIEAGPPDPPQVRGLRLQ